MRQITWTREIICWRHWRDHPRDRIRRLYCWPTTHRGNLSQAMQHHSGAPMQVTRVKMIQTVHNAALRTAAGVHKMASIDHLHKESFTLRVKDQSDMLSLQCPVNCLEEDHVSAMASQFKSQDPWRSIHSRHHSTVLPRLGSIRMKSHQNLHTTCGRFSY